MTSADYVKKARPLADERAVLTDGKYRITVLTTALIRFEYSENGDFCDRPTQKVVNRDFPLPEFKVVESENDLTIFTRDLEVRYDKKKFSRNGLEVKVTRGSTWHIAWRYGEETEDLMGTARTLDWSDGPVPLEHGIISRDGFSVMDDTASMELTEDGFVQVRDKNNIDFYFWGYQHRYLEALKDFYHLCGSVPLLPRYALGNWWSRYHRYTEEEYKELITRFEKEEIPFSVAVIDMDWHIVDDVPEGYGTGWTGWTWNPKFFPDHKAFADWLHGHGMKITLNIHPADGIRAFEDCYPAVARKMGIDPKSKEPVNFDVTDQNFLENYFDLVLHPLEEDGCDFWWIDWQQGNTTRIEGLDPLWMLNHYHFLDASRDGRRPMTFSRYAGPGSHRYPVGFSGDTVISWDSLRFQPYFTANASNIGYGWWSHDIGGHMSGIRDDELMARWVQLGVFSPIMRLHSTDNPFNGKEPWKYNRMVEENMKELLRFRQRLIPYLYSMNRLASREGLPLVRPMYYHDAEEEAAYEVPNCYWFGSSLIVSPITDPVDKESLTAPAAAWLPEGVWIDIFTGRKYQGGRKIDLYRELTQIPVLAKAGTILPLTPEEDRSNSGENPKVLDLEIFPGESGSFSLWEDAECAAEDLEKNWVCTDMSLDNPDAASCSAAKEAPSAGRPAVFTISAAKGNLSVIPQKRTYRLHFRKVLDAQAAASHPAECSYDKDSHVLTIELKDVPVDQSVVISFPGGLTEAEEDILVSAYNYLERAQIPYDLKTAIFEDIRRYGKGAVNVILARRLPEPLLGTILEILTATRDE